MPSRSARCTALLGLALCLPACTAIQRTHPSSRSTLEPLGRGDCRALLADRSDPEALRRAAGQSLAYFRDQPADRTLTLLNRPVTVRDLRAAAETIVAQSVPRSDIAGLCDRLTLVHARPASPLRIAGYYEPELPARRQRSERFRYPIYALPPDRVEIDLGKYCPSCAGTTVIGRVRNGEVEPYYSRAEIDAGALNGRAPEIAWLDDPIEAFFLHIQGSALLRFDDGVHLHVSYNGSNGRPYTALGTVLAAEGKMPATDVSLASLKAYLRAHPAEAAALMERNERYVFFRTVPVGPIGTLGVPLTAGRSVAADKRFYPPGAMAFVVFSASRPDEAVPPARIVFVQDAGAAVRGDDRLDVYWGSGDTAAAIAGDMNSAGEWYFFLPAN